MKKEKQEIPADFLGGMFVGVVLSLFICGLAAIVIVDFQENREIVSQTKYDAVCTILQNDAAKEKLSIDQRAALVLMCN